MKKITKKKIDPSKQVATTVILPIYVALPSELTSIALREINLSLVGDAEVNEYNMAGKMVGKYDDHENFPILQDAHYRLHRSKIMHFEFNVMVDGSLKFVREHRK
jgi:hypothetical protein